MIEVLIDKMGDKIVSFKISGHANHGKKGNDIVCAAVSTASQMTVIGILEHLNIEAKLIAGDGFLSVNLENVDLNEKEKEVQTLLWAMYKTIIQISEQYPNNILLL